MGAKEIVFAGTNLAVGKYYCPANHELWSTENHIGRYPTIAFPRVAVGIKHADHAGVVATPNHVVFYNAFHPYHRQLLDPRGDECEFISLFGRLLNEINEACANHMDNSPQRPFQSSHAPCSASAYLRQRALFEQLQTGADLDSVFVEEQYLLLLDEITLADRQFHQPSPVHANPCPFQRDQVNSAKQFIARNYCRSLKLEEIAAAVDSSIYHLCRIFKKFAGVTIHRFLTQLRLRSALERLLDSDRSILDISLDLGFSSQSHFTSAFRKSFGLSPGELRNTRGRSILPADD